MSNIYNEQEGSEQMGSESPKNQGLAQAPVSAIQRRRAALEELDEAKFSVGQY
jgi:hypothetical protein